MKNIILKKVTNVPMNELLSITDNIILYLKTKVGMNF